MRDAELRPFPSGLIAGLLVPIRVQPYGLIQSSTGRRFLDQPADLERIKKELGVDLPTLKSSRYGVLD